MAMLRPGFCSHPWYKARVSSTALRGEFGQLQRKWLGKDARAEQNSGVPFAVSSEKWSDNEPVREKVCPHIFYNHLEMSLGPTMPELPLGTCKGSAHPTSNHPLRALGRESF